MKKATNLKEMLELVKKAPKGSIIIYDEASDVRWGKSLLAKKAGERILKRLCWCGHFIDQHHHFVNTEEYIGGGRCKANNFSCSCEEFRRQFK